jgi:hypothetical protein
MRREIIFICHLIYTNTQGCNAVIIILIIIKYMYIMVYNTYFNTWKFSFRFPFSFFYSMPFLFPALFLNNANKHKIEHTHKNKNIMHVLYYNIIYIRTINIADNNNEIIREQGRE